MSSTALDFKQKISLWDQKAYLAIQKLPRPKIFIYLMWVLTLSGQGAAIWLAITLGITLASQDFTFFWTMLAGIAFLYISIPILKYLPKRERPTQSLDDKLASEIGLRSYSFPSGHAATSTYAFIILTKFYPEYWYWFLLLAILVIFSRLYLLKHYLSDVIAGILLGIIVAFATLYIFQ